MFNILDTFAGAGGFSLGFQLAGCEVSGAIERDQWAADTFAFNHPKATVLVGDIESFTNATLSNAFGNKKRPNIILGGPPCQGFSVCRKAAGDPTDPRNSLFSQFLRMAEVFTPDLMIMENVPNLIKARTASKQRVIDVIVLELQKRGFYVYFDILHAAHFGVPQIRQRLFVIASRLKLTRPFPAPTHTDIRGAEQDLFLKQLKECPSLWSAISDLPQLEARQGSEEMPYDQPPQNNYQRLMREHSAAVFNHKAMHHSTRMIARFASMKWGDSASDVPSHLKPYGRNSNGTISEKTYDQNNRRMYPDKPCHTVPASFYANFVHPYQNRNFTAREGARIQSFPDWYVFKGKPTVVSHKLLAREGRDQELFLCQYNQIGNAVPPLLAKVIAENIIEQWEK